ncbi:TrmB family transcriptional regulator sugar-binding domain-containing protein [Halospeciosus flavus]|uniref:TrmB family transcriptional regulator sugar-binding domain-containing protein n=1 Tax=Halospeciosus flavus TaxID=3032283 RepID=A0ABD5Z1C6_9EURY|nr:TrmB family transcriptional regulator sugar-binding domain-containing protein [Halospeciosus flavus]
MNDAELAELLGRFGLSEKEIDTYLTILNHGEAEAATIAEDAGVSKRYVYSLSEDLEERGFVQVNDHLVPTTIRANPPEKVVDQLENQLDAMGPALEERFSATQPTEDDFEVIKARATVIKRVEQLIDRATRELTLAIPASRLDSVRDALRSAVHRGVFVVLLLSDVDDPADVPDVAGVSTVARAWSQAMPTMVTADSQSGLVAPPDIVLRTNSDTRAIAFVQEELGPVIVGSFFGNYWPPAEELYVVDPPKLPVSYRNFRHAVLAATLHLKDGDDLRARGRGRFVDDGETSFDGVVTGVRQGLVKPTNNSFPVEHSLVVETEDGEYTVGGEGAFIEDIEADELTLYRE